MTFAEWTQVDGVDVLRAGDSRFVAQPITGKRGSAKFDIIDLDAQEFVCQVGKARVRGWLADMAKED